MSIKGQLTKAEQNTYGYTTVWVSGTRYGSDAKGKIQAEAGDIVEFDAFEKPGKDGRTWPTFKLQTFKKVAASGGNDTTGGLSGNGATGSVAGAGVPSRVLPANQRDSYWADKAVEGGKRDPRISYFASLERAIQFVDLALRNGAIGAYEKAKATGKLEVLTALVYETTQRIMSEAYTQEVPKPVAKASIKAVAEEAPAEAEGDAGDDWS